MSFFGPPVFAAQAPMQIRFGSQPFQSHNNKTNSSSQQYEGRCTMYRMDKGFGFISRSSDHRSFFAHITNTSDGSPLTVGNLYSFNVGPGIKGKPPQAINITSKMIQPQYYPFQNQVLIHTQPQMPLQTQVQSPKKNNQVENNVAPASAKGNNASEEKRDNHSGTEKRNNTDDKNFAKQQAQIAFETRKLELWYNELSLNEKTLHMIESEVLSEAKKCSSGGAVVVLDNAFKMTEYPKEIVGKFADQIEESIILDGSNKHWVTQQILHSVGMARTDIQEARKVQCLYVLRRIDIYFV